MLALVAVLLMFSVVLGFHELGHALLAYRFGVKIERIAIGFGKVFCRIKDKREIEWAVGIFPAGGYVQLLNTRIQAVPNEQYPSCFDKKPAGIRCLILLAGGFFNVLVAWVALFIVFSVGYSQYPAIVDKVASQSVAARAGLHAGDRIVALDFKRVNSWQQAGKGLIASLGHENVALDVINAHQQIRKLTMNLHGHHFSKQCGSFFNCLGMKPNLDPSHLQWVSPKPWLSALWGSLLELGSLCFFYLLMIKQLVTGVLPISLLLGPLGWFTASMTSFIQGFSAFMLFLATLNVVVGIVNYLPIPGLDGGSIVYVLLEKIRGKPLSIAMEILLYRFARIAFFMLVVQLILNDVVRYFQY